MCLESSGVSGGSVDEVLVGEARHPEFDVTIPYPPGEKNPSLVLQAFHPNTERRRQEDAPIHHTHI